MFAQRCFRAFISSLAVVFLNKVLLLLLNPFVVLLARSALSSFKRMMKTADADVILKSKVTIYRKVIIGDTLLSFQVQLHSCFLSPISIKCI